MAQIKAKVLNYDLDIHGHCMTQCPFGIFNLNNDIINVGSLKCATCDHCIMIDIGRQKALCKHPDATKKRRTKKQ